MNNLGAGSGAPLSSTFKVKDWSGVKRRAATATEIVAAMARIDGWKLTGDGPSLAIEKTFRFANYFETIAFVNALALVAHRQGHHPDLSVHFNRCVVRFNTHDAGGITNTDFECAAQIDALLA